jgi:hypothetical protein
MESTVQDRLISFIKYKGLTKNRFETMCGLGKRYVSNISKSISPDVAQRISLTFPDLNMGWVMAGVGEMLVVDVSKSREPNQDPIIVSADTMKLYLNLSDTVKSQQNTISVLTEMTTRRQEEISVVLTKMVGILDDMRGAPKKENVG